MGRRNYGMLVGRVIRGALKLRYLLLGGAVGGTVTLNKVNNHSNLSDDEIMLEFFRNTSNGEMDFPT